MMRYTLAVISFAFCSSVIAAVVGVIVIFSIQPKDPANVGPFYGFVPVQVGATIRAQHGDFKVGIGGEWWNLPGTVLGVLGGLHSARATIRGKKKRKSKPAKRVPVNEDVEKKHAVEEVDDRTYAPPGYFEQ